MLCPTFPPVLPKKPKPRISSELPRVPNNTRRAQQHLKLGWSPSPPEPLVTAAFRFRTLSCLLSSPQGSPQAEALCAYEKTLQWPSWLSSMKHSGHRTPSEDGLRGAGAVTCTPRHLSPLARRGRGRLAEAEHTCDYFWMTYCKLQVATLPCLFPRALWPAIHPLKISGVCFGKGCFLAGPCPISTAPNYFLRADDR